MSNKPTGKPFTSQTGRAASMRSPWRKQQFCHTERAKRYRQQFDREDAQREGSDDN